ncbi:DUF1819 family protein [Acetivibrio cellulolyticus]|uniref:DUF1819 family protein n=1 Tax=Acetivibrio cellulolyticus TaxID=35830 RepID=UPI0001E30173|nr:DUF1819 family protein [Acetivibrio cellulolyticus]
MDNKTYSANLTGAWFLFYEIKQIAKLIEAGLPVEDIKKKVFEENLFQHKTKSSIIRAYPSVLRRAKLLSTGLRKLLIESSVEDGKLINLYAISEDDLLFNEFLLEILKDKYESNHLLLEKRDVNMYFTHKAEQNEKVAAFTDATVNKLRQVYLRILTEVGILANPKSGELNRIFVEAGIRDAIVKNGGSSFVKIFESK